MPLPSIEGSAAVASGGTTTGPISTEGMSRGAFSIPATFTSTAVTFSVSHDQGVTYTALYNASNALVSITVAVSRAYPLPAEVFGATSFKMVFGSAEGGARVVKYSLTD